MYFSDANFLLVIYYITRYEEKMVKLFWGQESLFLEIVLIKSRSEK